MGAVERTHRDANAWFAGLALLALAAITTSCDDAPVNAGDEAGQTAAACDPATVEVSRWQDVRDATPVALFVARAIAPCDEIGPDDPRVAAYRERLDSARRHYIENTRMIANRLLQAETALRERGQAVPFDTLLRSLDPPQAGRPVSIGRLLHHYFNLRNQGLDHADAIDRLRVEDRERAR